MKALGYLLLIAFMLSIGHANYSINELIDFLQDNGHYKIIQMIKCCLGKDVASEYCKQLVETEHCDEVVKVYMTNCGSSPDYPGAPMRKPNENDLNQKARMIYDILDLDTVDDTKRQLVIIVLFYYNNLIKTMTDEEIYDFINIKILNRKTFLPYKKQLQKLMEQKEKEKKEIEKSEIVEK